jgi:hypothetical protein
LYLCSGFYADKGRTAADKQDALNKPQIVSHKTEIITYLAVLQEIFQLSKSPVNFHAFYFLYFPSLNVFVRATAGGRISSFIIIRPSASLKLRFIFFFCLSGLERGTYLCPQ